MLDLMSGYDTCRGKREGEREGEREMILCMNTQKFSPFHFMRWVRSRHRICIVFPGTLIEHMHVHVYVHCYSSDIHVHVLTSDVLV